MPSEASPPSVPSTASPPRSGAVATDEVDPELLALPDPPRTERTFTLALLAATALASCAMAWALQGDVAYAFASSSPVDLGELHDVKGADLSADNGYVRGHGALGAVGAIRFERPFEGDSFRVSPVAGRRDLWVEVRVPAGEEGGRYVPPSTFAGRLVAFDDAGPRHRGLVSAIEAVGLVSSSGGSAREKLPAGARLMVDGEAPSGARWAVALAAVFLAFGLWNALAIVRLLRRPR